MRIKPLQNSLGLFFIRRVATRHIGKPRIVLRHNAARPCAIPQAGLRGNFNIAAAMARQNGLQRGNQGFATRAAIRPALAVS